jgi:hypothetical protein
MKRTKITYLNQSDTLIKILKIENVASYSELRQEFGRSVAMQYIKGGIYYKRSATNPDVVRINLALPRSQKSIWLRAGFSYTKATFNTAIKRMKAAGGRLTALRQQYEYSEQKEILI